MADPTEEKSDQPIIIKKIVKGAGHHGGAWKVAYADFVTAMMAFFLLLWLLNVSTDEELNAISNFFDPTHPVVSDSQSGSGGVMGGLSMTPEGAMATNAQTLTMPTPSRPNTDTRQARDQSGKTASTEEMKREQAKEIMRKQEEERYKEAEEKIKQAIQDDPELAALSKNLIIDMTPEGLRIQIVDQEGEPMFPSGSARMYDKTRNLIEKVGKIVKTLPNDISVRGHTDSTPYGAGANYTNWELSSDRANASRRVLLDSGVPAERVNNVMGKADTEHLVPDAPTSAKNRRISIILLREELTNPDYDKKVEKMSEDVELEEGENNNSSGTQPTQQVPIGTFRKTPGSVQFP